MAEQPRRARHLMDPANPQRMVNDASLTNVQQWVTSVLVVFTVAHLALGFALLALALPESATAGRIGLNVIAAAFGVLGLAAGFAIHRHKVLNAWLLLGVLPGILGLWLAFG